MNRTIREGKTIKMAAKGSNTMKLAVMTTKTARMVRSIITEKTRKKEVLKDIMIILLKIKINRILKQVSKL
jgi:hypothetical protein